MSKSRRSGKFALQGMLNWLIQSVQHFLCREQDISYSRNVPMLGVLHARIAFMPTSSSPTKGMDAIIAADASFAFPDAPAVVVVPPAVVVLFCAAKPTIARTNKSNTFSPIPWAPDASPAAPFVVPAATVVAATVVAFVAAVVVLFAKASTARMNTRRTFSPIL